MIDDPTWSKMVGQLARGWAADKTHDRNFRKQVTYEAIEKYVEVRRQETGESKSKAAEEAAKLYDVSIDTVWRAIREVKKMRSTGTKAVSRK